MSEILLTRKIKTVCLECGGEVFAMLEDGVLQVERCRPCISKRVDSILKGGSLEEQILQEEADRFAIKPLKED